MNLLNKLRFVFELLLLITFASCNSLMDVNSPADIPATATEKSLLSISATPESSKSPALLAGQNWVVFDQEYAEEMGVGSWLLESDGFWTPALDDISKVEAEIAGYLSRNSHLFYHQPPVWQRLDEYQRQYIGFGRKGGRFIYGNFFCDSGSANWREDLVSVEDGGECFFQVEYDPEGGLFTKIMVNGES